MAFYLSQTAQEVQALLNIIDGADEETITTTYWKSSLASLQAITGSIGERAAVTENGITTFYYWSGSAWVGSIVNGGSGSGDVATDTIWDAAGDLAVGTGANTATKVSISAESIIARIGAANVAPITVAEQTLVGRITGGSIDDLSATQVRTLLNVADGATANTLTDSTSTVSSTVAASATAVKAAYDLANGKQASDTKLSAIAGLTFADASIIQLTGTAAAAVLTSGGNHYFLKSNSNNSALEFAIPTEVLTALGIGAVEIDAHTAQTPTTIQLASINMTTIHNYDQAAVDINNTLPATAANLCS